MTREEAIDIIKCLAWHTRPTEEMIEQAIKELKQESTVRNCFGCKYAKDNHNAGTEECHLCMWENQYKPTAKNELGVDCISKAEVKKIAKEMYLEVANMELDVDTISDCISCTSSKCREVLERKLQALPSVTPRKPRWIPVTERLPEKDTAVLTYVDTGASETYCLAYWNDLRNDMNGAWEEWIGSELIEIDRGYKVLAWMPLPEPYKEDEE